MEQENEKFLVIIYSSLARWASDNHISEELIFNICTAVLENLLHLKVLVTPFLETSWVVEIDTVQYILLVYLM